MHSAHTAAPQRATDAPARHGVRVRSRQRPPRAQNMLARRGTTKYQPQQAHAERQHRTCTHASMQRAQACSTHAPMHPRANRVHPGSSTHASTSEPRAPRKLVGGRSAHERGLGGMVMLSSPPASLTPRRVYLPCSSAWRVQRPTWTGTWPRGPSVYPSRRRVAARPHRRVRGIPDLRHEKVRCLSILGTKAAGKLGGSL